MHDDDFEIFEELMGDGDEEPELTPTWRATIRGEKLMLTGWAQWMITGGPLGALLPARARSGVTIADLTVHGAEEDEISVSFLVRAKSAPERAEAVLIDWAGKVGHRRVWLPDRLVEIEPDPEAIARASVRCEACHAKWSDATPEFWLGVREAKAFPKWCPVCGCELPQGATGAMSNTHAKPTESRQVRRRRGDRERHRHNRSVRGGECGHRGHH
jgi:hypothetical protein